jgi:hypothetical protein
MFGSTSFLAPSLLDSNNKENSTARNQKQFSQAKPRERVALGDLSNIKKKNGVALGPSKSQLKAPKSALPKVT